MFVYYYSLFYPFIHLFIDQWIRLIDWLIDSFIDWFIDSLIHIFINVFIYLCLFTVYAIYFARGGGGGIFVNFASRVLFVNSTTHENKFTFDPDARMRLVYICRVLVNSRKPVIFSGCEAQSCRLLVLKKKKRKEKKKGISGKERQTPDICFSVIRSRMLP